MRYATEMAPAVPFDWATGLYRRWYIEARTDDELAHALRSGARVFVVRVQSSASDAERLTVWLRTGLRSSDLAGVVGPATFAITLVDTDEERVEALVHRMRGAVDVPLITSVVKFPDDGLTFDALLRAARAKRAGERAA